MKLPALATFLSLFVLRATAETVTCEFGSRTIGGVSLYSCVLQINGTAGAEVTEIGGTHLAGRTDADVLGIVRLSGSLTAIPAVICARFPNLQRVALPNAGLTVLADDALRGCPRLTWLSLLSNRIGSVSAGAFANNPELTFLDLDSNSLSTLPEAVFRNLSRLESLDLRSNPLTAPLPDAIFRDLTSLSRLFLQSTGMRAINPLWFNTTTRLVALYLGNNQIETISANNVATLTSLELLSLFGNRLGFVGGNTFAALRNLRFLDIAYNGISLIHPLRFAGLEMLTTLDMSGNNLTAIGAGAFRQLANLDNLYLSGAGIRRLDPAAFEGLTQLTFLNLNFNEIEDLPAGVFAPMASLSSVNLWQNRLKTVRRDIFGANVASLTSLDLDENVINGVERRLIDDAASLQRLFFLENICADVMLVGIERNRTELMERLGRCFRNYELTVETTTDNNAQYQFYPASLPGLVTRVQAVDTIEIALSPVNGTASQLIEVLIGTANNTLSVIRANQQTDVAVVPSPGIISEDESLTLRVAWVNNVVLVFRGNDQWPFLVHTMAEPFDVNFYGLRSQRSRASWIVQPIGI